MWPKRKVDHRQAEIEKSRERMRELTSAIREKRPPKPSAPQAMGGADLERELGGNRSEQSGSVVVAPVISFPGGRRGSG